MADYLFSIKISDYESLGNDYIRRVINLFVYMMNIHLLICEISFMREYLKKRKRK